jgi:hypothetical protein
MTRRKGFWAILLALPLFGVGLASRSEAVAATQAGSSLLAIRWDVVSEGVKGDDGKTYYRLPATVRFTVDGAAPGPVRLEWSRDGVIWQPVEGTVSVSGPSAHVRAEDSAGHTAEAVAAWPVDTTPPKIALQIDGRVIDASETKFRVHEGDVIPLVLTDAASGIDKVRAYLGPKPVDFSVQGGPWQPNARGLRFSIRGTYVVEVEAVDRVGNVGRVTWKAVVRRAKHRTQQPPTQQASSPS